MTGKNLMYLALFLLVLVCGYWLVSDPNNSGERSDGMLILADIDVEKIAGINVVQGEKKVELKLKDGVWVLPERGNYLSNSEKVRSLLLKMLDSSKSQTMPSSDEGLKKLGLDEEGVKGGKSKVIFTDAEGKELGGLYLGELRDKKKLPDGGLMPMGGQYVRRLGGQEVFLIPAPVTISADTASWLESTVANVLSSKVSSVVQEKSSGDSYVPEFTLTNSAGEGGGSAGAKEFSADVTPGPGEEINSLVLSQVASGLENMRLSDVHQASSPEVAKLEFDLKTVYRLLNGLVYTVVSAKKDEKVFVKIAVDFDSTFAEKRKAEALAKAKEQANDSASSAVSSMAEQSSSAIPTPTTDPVAALELSNADEAVKLQNQFAPWIYELASYQGERFRKSRAELMKLEEKKQEDISAEVAEEALPQ